MRVGVPCVRIQDDYYRVVEIASDLHSPCKYLSPVEQSQSYFFHSAIANA